MVELESNLCINDLRERVEKENLKLKLTRYTNSLFYICILLFLVFAPLTKKYSLINEFLVYYVFFFILPFLAFYIFIIPIISTNINSSEVIAYHLSEIAEKLDLTILNDTNKKRILRGLSEIKRESGLIHSYFDGYSPTDIRERRAPFVTEILQFLNDLDSICRKISFVVKHETETDLDSLQLSLHHLTIHLCENRNRITNVECHLREISDVLSGVPEDERLVGSRFERFRIEFSEAWNRSFWLRLLIPAIGILIPYFLLFYPEYQIWAVLLVTAIIAWAAHK